MVKKVIIFVTLFIAVLIIYEVARFSSSEIVEIKVNDKEQIIETSTDADGKSTITAKYLVYAESETFENTDVLFLGKWNSSDIQGKLKADETFKVKVYGWRVPFFSMYRNIVSIE